MASETREGRISDAGVGERARGALRLWREAGSGRPKLQVALYSATTAIVIGLNVFGQIRLNAWQGAFFDAIGQRDAAAFVHQLGVFALVVGSLLVLVVAQTWLAERIKVQLRGLVTQDLLDLWLAPKRAYLLQFAGDIGAHPDQRVHEDARHLCELATDLAIGLVQSTLLLASFAGVLWVLSAGMAIPIGGRDVVVPGYMLWCALAYAMAGSWLTWMVGRPLVRLNAERYGAEGVLRATLLQLDEGAQTIALYGAEGPERRAAGEAFDKVQTIGRKLADALARLTWVTSAYGWGAMVAPVIAAMPAYFSGSLSLGGLMMAVGAFTQVQQALRWYVDNYPRIADCEATLRRVNALREALAGIGPATGGSRLELAPDAEGGLSVGDIRLDMASGTSVLDGAPLRVEPGEHLLVTGDPGTGKSTLIQTFAGLWSAGSGSIGMPPEGETMFLPQRPYLPHGTLRNAFHCTDGGMPDAAIRAALEKVGLPHLAGDLDLACHWDRDLPLDEQQGIALARLLLERPRWIFIDNGLSGFDDQRRRSLLALLGRELPQSAVVATSRSDPHDPFWSRVVRLRRVSRGKSEPVVPANRSGLRVIPGALGDRGGR